MPRTYKILKGYQKTQYNNITQKHNHSNVRMLFTKGIERNSDDERTASIPNSLRKDKQKYYKQNLNKQNSFKKSKFPEKHHSQKQEAKPLDGVENKKNSKNQNNNKEESFKKALSSNMQKQKSLLNEDKKTSRSGEDLISSQNIQNIQIEYPYETDSNYNTQNKLDNYNVTQIKNLKQLQQIRNRDLTNPSQARGSDLQIFDSAKDLYRGMNSQVRSSELIQTESLLEQQKQEKRTNAIKNFQFYVKKALMQKRMEKERDQSKLGKSSSSSVPISRKFSFFDVVRRINPFTGLKTTKNKVGTADQFQEPQLTSRGLLDTQREQTLTQAEIEEKKRQRARQLWRKAKSVLKAIMTWKAVQAEIQLYGTHNYEFRRNFKLAKQQASLVSRKSTVKDNYAKKENKKCEVYFHPDHKFKKIWGVIMVFLLLYVATLMPFNIAFQDLEIDEFWFFVENIVDFAFITDFLINCISAYYDEEGKLVTNNKKIILHYLKTWFVIDIIASFPFTLVQSQIDHLQAARSYNKILRLLRLPRLYRLLKISRIVKLLSFLKKNPFIQRIQDFLQINAGVLRLIQFVLTALICVHVVACLWYFSARMDDFDPETWVVRFGIQDSTRGRQYLASLYWSITTVLTVGYGDIHAGTNIERLISVLWMMIGVGFYSFTIGTLTSVLSKIDTRQSQLKSKIEVIEVFCSEAKIHPDIKKKIKEALEYNSLRNAFSWIEKYAIFNELPPNLKCEVAMQIHDGAIGKLPFFQNKDYTFIGNIVPLLQPLRVLECDYIYMKDDHPYDIYFIVKGRVNFVMDIGECVFKQWPQGSYFGEIEIIFQRKRICTAKAGQNCDLFTLNKKFYQTIIYNDYPEIDKNLRELAQKREQKIIQTLNKAKKVLDAIGISDNINPIIQRITRTGSLGSFQGNKQKRYYKKISKASTINIVKQSFDQAERRHSQSQSKIDDLKEKVKKSRDKSDSQSSSSGEYNIWGNKQHSSDNSGKRRSSKSVESSFHTDKSLQGKQIIEVEKENEEERKIPQYKMNLQQNKRSAIGYPKPFSYNRDSTATMLQLVKEEGSLESGSVNKAEKMLKSNSNESYTSSKDVIKEEEEEEKDESSIPKIKIIQEHSYGHQDLNTLNSNDPIKTPMSAGNCLEIIPQNFHDSNFFSAHNDSPPQNLFKYNLEQAQLSPQHDDSTLDQNQSNLVNIQAPKIKINDKTYNDVQLDISKHNINRPSPPQSPNKIIQNPPKVSLELDILQPSLSNKNQQSSKKQTSSNMNKELHSMSNKIRDIQKDMQVNKTQFQALEEKVSYITSSLDQITTIIKDIANKQSIQHEQVKQSQNKIKEQEEEIKRQQPMQGQKRIRSSQQIKYNDQQRRLRQENVYINPQSFSLSSNSSLLQTQRDRTQKDRRQQETLAQQRRGDFTYNEDLEALQREYGDAHEMSNTSLPDQ